MAAYNISDNINDGKGSYADRLKALSDYYNYKLDALINFLVKEGYAFAEIARVLGVSRQAVTFRYNHKGGKK